MSTPSLSPLGAGVVILPNGASNAPGLPPVQLPQLTPQLQPGDLQLDLRRTPVQPEAPQPAPPPEEPQPQPGETYVHPSLLGETPTPVLPAETQQAPLPEPELPLSLRIAKFMAESMQTANARVGAGIASVPMFPVTAAGLAQQGLKWAGEQTGLPLDTTGAADLLGASDRGIASVRQTLKPGLQAPKGVIESLPEMLGSAMVPVGAMPAAARMLVPGTHVYTPANIAINTAIPTALVGAIGHLTGETGSDPTFGNPVFGNPLISPAQGATLGPQPGQPYVDPLLLSNSSALTPPTVVNNSPTWFQRNAGYVGAGALAGVLAIALRRNIAQRMSKPATALGTTSASKEGTVTGIADAIGQQWLDSEGPTSSFLKQTLGKKAGVAYEDLVQTSTRNAGAASSLEALRTGMFPGNSAVRSYPFSKLATDYHALPEDMRKVFDDGLIADTTLNQRSQAAIASNSNAPYVRSDRMINPATGLQYTEDELRSSVQALDAVPQLAAMRAQYRDVLDKALDYASEQGYLNQATKAQFQRANPGYAPLMDGKPRPATIAGALSEILEAATTEGRGFREVQSMLERSNDAFSGVAAPLNAMDSLEQYMMGFMTAVQRNTATRQFFKSAEEAIQLGAFDNKGKTFVFAPKSKAAGGDVITYKENGQQRSVEVRDPFIAEALKFDPHSYGGILNGMRHVFQSGTTGALNPLFSVRAMMYDALAQEIGRPAGQGIGIANRGAQAISKYLFNKAIGIPGDPSAVLTAVAGIPRALAAQMKYDLSMRLRAAMTNGMAPHGVGRMIDDTTLSRWSDALLDSYTDSSISTANRYGGVNAGYMGTKTASNPASILHEVVTNAHGPLSSVMDAYRYYKYALESVHNAARLENVATNEAMKTARAAQRTGRTLTPYEEAQMRNLMGETRRVPGDLSRTGSGQTARGFLGAVPYLNTTLQGMRGLGRAIKDRPGTTAIGVFNSIIMGKAIELSMVAGMSPKDRWEYFNTMTQDQHSQSIKIWMPGAKSVRDFYEIPIYPDLQPIAALATDIFTSLAGPELRNDAYGSETHDISALHAMAKMFDLPLPPALGVAIQAGNMATGGTMQTGSTGELLRTMPTATGGGYESDSQRDYVDVMSNSMRNMIANVTGTLGANLTEAGREGVLSMQPPRNLDPVQALQESLSSFAETERRVLPGSKPGDAVTSAFNSKRAYVDDVFAKMKDVMDEFTMQEKRGGAVGSMRPGSSPPLIQLQGIQDPQFRMAMQYVAGNMRVLTQLRTALSDAKSLERQGRSLPVVRIDREHLISQSRLRQATLYEQALVEVRRVESLLSSSVYSGQPVDLRKLGPAH